MAISLEGLKRRVRSLSKLLFFLYFAALAVTTAYVTCTLWLAGPKEGAPELTGDRGPTKSCASAAPVPYIDHLDPPSIAIGENYVNIAVYGCNLRPKPIVRFNGVERTSNSVTEKELIVSLQASDFAAPGSIAVIVETQDSDKPLVSNASTLRVTSTSDIKATWVVFRSERTISLEVRLILLMLFVGAFAACISGMKSFADYAGQKKLEPSWYWFYCAEPLIGAGLALVFYLVTRGGFLAGTNADIKAVNPFGFVALAALVGMFSDAAFRKLNEVFDTLFQAKDTRSDSLTSLTVRSDPLLPAALHGKEYVFSFEAAGGRPPYSWSAVTGPPAGLALSKDGKLSGTPAEAAAESTFTIQVADNAGAKATKEFRLVVQ